MKKLLFLMFAAALGFTALSCKDRENVKTTNTPEFNFRKTKWGMTRDQVKAAEGSQLTGEKTDVVTYRDEFEGIPVIVGYIFDGEKLVKAGYLMRGTYEDPNKYIDDYNKIKESMISVYGAPAQDELQWKEGEQSQDPSQFGKAVCDGKLTYFTIWTDGVTMIRERLMGEDGKCSHGVMFESVDLYLNKPLQENAASVPTPGPGKGPE